MIDESIKCVIRAASLEDADFLLEIRNDPEIIALGSSKRAVDPQEHRTWLTNVLKSDSHLVFVVESPDQSESIGYARLDRDGADMAVITTALIKFWRGRSIGSKVIRMVSEIGFHKWKRLRFIIANVRTENLASARAFMNAGFVRMESLTLEDHNVYGLERNGELPDDERNIV